MAAKLNKELQEIQKLVAEKYNKLAEEEYQNLVITLKQEMILSLIQFQVHLLELEMQHLH